MFKLSIKNNYANTSFIQQEQYTKKLNQIISEEDITNEDISSEDTNNEDTNEYTNNEDTNNEDTNNEDINSEDINSEDTNNEDTNNEDASDEDTNNEREKDKNKSKSNETNNCKKANKGHVISKLQVPKYNENESIAKYKTRVEKYKMELAKNKYQLILNFINDWLEYDDRCKIKSLTEFKNISKSESLSNNKHNKKIIEKYSESINNVFGINYKNPDIIYLLTRMLSSINYKLYSKDVVNSKTKHDDQLYTILLSPK